MDINNIEDTSIVLIPSYKKNSFIKMLNSKFLNVKIMSLDEFIKKLTFDFDEKSIFSLMKRENIKYEIAREYIKNLYYIENKDYNNLKLNKLVDIKNFLDENNLLIYDSLFKDYVKNKKIYVIGYDYINKFQKRVLDSYNVQVIKSFYDSYEPVIHEFNTITEEIEFVAYSICCLIDNGCDINSIKLVNVGSDYYNEIRRIFGFYNIPINLNDKNIYGTCIVKDFIDLYQDDISVTLDLLRSKHNFKNETNNRIYNKIVDICNDYAWCSSYLDVKDLIINKLKSTSIRDNFSNSICVTDLESINGEYTFILGFNQGCIPKIYKDEDYIDDLNKELLGIETSIENNVIERDRVISLIRNIKNVVITYKLKSPFQTFYPSSIIDSLSSSVIKSHENALVSYSSIYDQIRLTKKIDNLIKYGINDNFLSVLYSNYQIDYNSYDNSYKKIDRDKLLKFLDNKLLLSYSSLDNYYHCSFRYYINNILKLNVYEETFSTKIGNLFHYVLENTFKNNDDYKVYFDSYISGMDLTNKERFLINELESNLMFTVDTIKKHLKYCSLSNTLYEKKIYVNKSSKVTFMGVVDKLLYEELPDKTIVAVIDYKTGNTSIDLNKTYYGLSMQLPIYLYLADKCELKNVKVAGFYLQNIISNETVAKSDDIIKDKEDALKLNGYSNSNKDILKYFDSSYENSFVVKSLRTKSDGNFYSYSKILNDDQISSLISLVDKKIDEASNDILDANFSINPKQIGFKKDSLVGCSYCSFKDICFRNEKDIVILKEQDYKEFLGGDIDA